MRRCAGNPGDVERGVVFWRAVPQLQSCEYLILGRFGVPDPFTDLRRIPSCLIDSLPNH
jgi:hypothetical protein